LNKFYTYFSEVSLQTEPYYYEFLFTAVFSSIHTDGSTVSPLLILNEKEPPLVSTLSAVDPCLSAAYAALSSEHAIKIVAASTK
jgi:hypothetical protein